LSGYVTPRVVVSAADLDGCDLVISTAPWLEAPILPAVREAYPYQVRVGSDDQQGVVYTNSLRVCREASSRC
jgi:hypothetical protein